MSLFWNSNNMLYVFLYITFMYDVHKYSLMYWNGSFMNNSIRVLHPYSTHTTQFAFYEIMHV